MPSAVTVTAPCKVNLSLDVFPPRADGFHDLDSVVVQFAPPADELRVTVEPATENSVTLECSDPTLPPDGRNLAHRAAVAFLAAFPPPEPVAVRITLAKRLPSEAGLGGGSSDAAAVLLALASLLPCDADRLPEGAAGLGSDVPLFLHPGPVRMRGRGEVVEPLLFENPPLYGVIVKPGVGVPTGPAYAALDALPGREPGRATARVLDALRRGASPDALGAAMGNDFEAAILPAYPEVAAAHRVVSEAGAVRALLCGSGAAVFGLARDRDHARALTAALCGRFPYVHLAEGRP